MRLGLITQFKIPAKMQNFRQHYVQQNTNDNKKSYNRISNLLLKIVLGKR